MDAKLLQYVPKFYKPYVADIYLGERVWNEHTRKWNTQVVVEWDINGEQETTTYQNATYMYNTLKDFGNDFIDAHLCGLITV